MEANRPAADAPRVGAREIDLRELTGPGREVIIHHNGERYRLRVTSNQKLILTK